MMREKLVASDFLAKDVLNLENGDLMGAVSGFLIADAPLRVTAMAFYNEQAADSAQRLGFCDYAMVTDVNEQVVVVSSCPSYLPGDGKNLLGLTCVDCNGKVVGEIVDFVWHSIDGVIVEMIALQHDQQAIIPITVIDKIGSGAVVLNVDEDMLQKQATDRTRSHEKNGEEDAEELLHTLIKRVGTTLSAAGQRVGERVKQIDTDEINREVNRFTEKVGKELRVVIETISEQTRTPKNATMESEVTSVLRDLENYSVSNPIYDCRGDLIVMPGQVVNEDVIRRVIENDKIAELYRVAVSVKSGDNNE